MNQRIAPEVLDYMVAAYAPPYTSYDDCAAGRLALDLKDARAEIERLNSEVEKIIKPFDGIEHWEDCKARERDDYDGIDDEPLDHLEGCDCSVKMFHALYCLIKPPKPKVA